MTGALDASYFGARSHARMGAQCTAIGARPVVASSHTRHKSARKIFVSLHGVAQATVPRISASHAARWRPPALAKALVPLSDRRACLFCECTSRAAPLLVVSAVHHFRYPSHRNYDRLLPRPALFLFCRVDTAAHFEMMIFATSLRKQVSPDVANVHLVCREHGI